MPKTDVVVLGAGIVGVSAALHLQARGRDVVLLDRCAGAGLETSFGNAGLIERSSIYPYFFPRDPLRLAKYAFNLLPEAHYHFSALPQVGPWLWRYFRAAAPASMAQSFAAFRPLIEHSLSEHAPLIDAAGAQALVRHDGWIKLFRSSRSFDAGAASVAHLRSFGLNIDVLDTAALAKREPALAPMSGALHFHDTAGVYDPGALSQAYLDLFLARGGRFVEGDARTLAADANGWRVDAVTGPVLARDVVVALGPWSDLIFRPLGYAIPLGVKRGYHMHYALAEGVSLNHPTLDADTGYLLAPMARGVRLTTGAEFARRDAPSTPVQLEKCEPVARALLPGLRERLDPAPWRGARPCLPDMLPVIGAAPRHRGLWFDFGHAHHGLTLGPATGRLLAELMVGETPYLDPRPYRPDRF
jgi:D-amino-acid dehydrogenase